MDVISDLARVLFRHPHYNVFEDRAVANLVATHKSRFYAEKDIAGTSIDYHAAVAGNLTLIPQGPALNTLHDDYNRMTEAGLLTASAPSFPEIMGTCEEIQHRANAPCPTPLSNA